MRATWIVVGLGLTPCSVWANGLSLPTVTTTSGILEGASTDGVFSFKGIPFAQPPVGDLRWEPPQSFTSKSVLNATHLAPSCVQQFVFATAPFIEPLFNTPAPPESEDCLYLNVWTPSLEPDASLPVAFWIYGGSLQFGTASLPFYDGTSFAKNQGIVIVTINYRTNIFGFPSAEELYPFGENLGFLDQELALQWVQHNIAAFGGDPNKVTIMGESAGGESVSYSIYRHPINAPFRAAIIESGAAAATSPIANFTPFDTFAKDMNCTQVLPGPERLACLKAVPANTIRAWTNGPSGLTFSFVVDGVTVPQNPFPLIDLHLTAQIPILLGANEDDGTLFTVGVTNLTALLASFGGLITADEVRALYPGLSDSEIIPKADRDLTFVCPASLTAAAFVGAGISNVYRYIYGAVFADLQVFPGAGAWHSSEIPEIFGTYDPNTATPDEITLSQTMQTVWANFVKDPYSPPAPNWQRYLPNNATNTLAKLAYDGNVQLSNVVQASPSELDDGPCILWDGFLDY